MLRPAPDFPARAIPEAIARVRCSVGCLAVGVRMMTRVVPGLPDGAELWGVMVSGSDGAAELSDADHS